MKDVYKEEYLPSIIRIGRIVFIISLILFFMPFFATWLVLGVEPQWPQIMKAGGTWFAMNLIFWIVEPISFFPVMGVPGSFIGGLAGNGSNLRIPCAVAAQKATRTEPGTVKGQVVSTIGICISVFVNIFILAAGVLVGQRILSMLPPSVISSLNYLLPALYGCMFAQFIEGNEVGAGVAVVLAMGTLLLSRNGMLNWIPGDIGGAMPLVVPVFGTLAIMLFLHKGTEKKRNEEKTEGEQK